VIPQDNDLTLHTLGWSAFFAQQIDIDTLTQTPPVRVVSVHRNGLNVIGEGITDRIQLNTQATVGDWLLFNTKLPHKSQLLERKSLLKRRAPGTDRQIQLIAANIDTVFIVTSCNEEFNVARLERYIALILEADIEPVILLTKSDLVSNPEDWVAKASTISDAIQVISLDARGSEPEKRLAAWCRPGRTVAFVGSSGVGKSTLTNALLRHEVIVTQGIREDDAHGRHTTTHREIHLLPGGGLVIDTPGMRELQLTDAAQGIKEVFHDIEELVMQCRFSDCQHDSEPGCAIQRAISDETLDPERLKRWRKLRLEDEYNSSSLAERREKDRGFGKMVRRVMSEKARYK
jgi:ribosome biogenesis GTPase